MTERFSADARMVWFDNWDYFVGGIYIFGYDRGEGAGAAAGYANKSYDPGSYWWDERTGGGMGWCSTWEGDGSGCGYIDCESMADLGDAEPEAGGWGDRVPASCRRRSRARKVRRLW